MTSKLSKIEANVIDDKLLTDGLLVEKYFTEAEKASGAADINLVEEGIHTFLLYYYLFSLTVTLITIIIAPNAQSLILSFKKIIRIENLIGFDSLIKLCLDNNNIEEITGISHLKKLRWLDLSFNKIKKIQGLDTLTQIEDLSLYSNKISSVEGLEKLDNLQCLSLGNNRIDSLEQVIKLRQLRSLRMLALADNPVAQESEYKMVILAFIDTLLYIDYALVDVHQRHIAKEQYHDELLDAEEKESIVNQKVESDKALASYMVTLDKAGALHCHTIFDDLFNDDNDVDRLKSLPGIKEAIDQFRTSFKAMAEEIIQDFMQKYEKKSKEINEFEGVVLRLRATAEADSTQLIGSFGNSKQALVQLLTHETKKINHAESVQHVKKLQDELDKVCDELMSIELRLVERFDVLVDDFDNRLVEMKTGALETQQVFFRAIEELEDKFSGAIRGVVQDLIDRLSREEISEDYLNDEAMSLIVDKDTCMSLISQSHDMHIGRILKNEDNARTGETKRYQDLIFGYINSEKTRNRDRVLQIHEFSRGTKNTINALLQNDDDEVDNDDQ